MNQTITYYSDTTSAFPIAYETLFANRHLLFDQNIYLPPISSQALYQISSHRVAVNNLFTFFRKKYILNNIWSNWYYKLKHAVEDGKDVLLYGYIEGKKLPLFSYIRNIEPFKRCSFKIILVRGRLACEMEQYAYMHNLNWHTSEASIIEYTLNKTRNNCGLGKTCKEADEVRIFFDMNESCIADKLSSTQKKALSCAGVPIDKLQIVSPAHTLTLRTQTARCLLAQTRVGDNTWPPIDEKKLIIFLHKLEGEEHFDSSLFTTPYMRKRLCDNEQKLFEELSSTNDEFIASQLGCPAAMRPEVQWQSFGGLSDGEMESFARKIPTSLAYVIKRRFLIDPELMSQEQKKLNRLLEFYKPQKKIFIARQEPVLSVLTMTYNHENYIGKCIESVQSQKTNFEIEHIIIDDCSTDSTPEIIKRYASKYPNIRPVLLGNKSSNGRNVSGLLGRCRTEFASLCDGDDFFTHNDKLQRQVDFLRDHQECSLCFHFVDVVYEDGSPTRVHPPIEEMPGGLRMFYPISALLHFNCIQTNSVVYRWRFRDGLPSWFDPTLCPGDWYWHLLHAENGLLGFIPEHMSVYRRHKKALYIETEKGNLVLHRARFGMQELRLYHVLNSHFKGKYFPFFFKLANPVFFNFVQLYLNSGESNLLERAIKTYPLFADKFFQAIKVEANVLIPKIEKFFTAS